MKVQLSEHFNYKKLFLFTFPSIIMMIFLSIYSIVDGYFVSNFAGKSSFAAVNLIMPVLQILGAFGFMFGTGGSALVSKTIGENNLKKANKIFSLLIITVSILGIIIAVSAFIFLNKIVILLGATGQMLKDAVLYGRIILISLPFYILQSTFQSFFVTAEKPQYGLYVTLASGITNMILDAIFIIVFKWGLVGAAVATMISEFIGGVIPIIYFSRKNNSSLLHFVKPKFDIKALIKSMSNGSSEFVSNISMSIVGLLYNFQLLKYIGENGIAAYGVLMYVSMIFVSIFIGYITGIAPIISFNFGAKNKKELTNIFKKSIFLISLSSITMFILAELTAPILAKLYVGYDLELLNITINAARIGSFTFIFIGMSVFGSSFFTALNDGVTSAIIAFLRTMVFQVGSILLFPTIWGVNGIWYSICFAEILSTLITLFYFYKHKNTFFENTKRLG